MGNTKYLLPMLLTLLSGYSQASIVLSATRVIFNEQQADASIRVENTGSRDVLIQSWVDPMDGSNVAPPFIVTPPLAELPVSRQQQLQILYNGSALPNDRESVFWLSVQEIPQAVESGKNTLQLALMQRVKLFYRPAALAGSANQAPASMKVQLANGQVTFSNPTPFNLNLVTLKQGSIELDLPMVTPFSSATIPAAKLMANGVFTVSSVNDFGGINTYRAELKQGINTPLLLQR